MPTPSAVVVDGNILMGFICGGILGAVIGSLVGAVIFRISAFWAERLVIPYFESFMTVLAIGLICGSIGVSAGFAMGVSNVDEAWLVPFNIVYIPSCFLLRCILIAKFNNLLIRQGFKIALFEIMTTIIAVAVVAGMAFCGLTIMNAMG